MRANALTIPAIIGGTLVAAIIFGSTLFRGISDPISQTVKLDNYILSLLSSQSETVSVGQVKFLLGLGCSSCHRLDKLPITKGDIVVLESYSDPTIAKGYESQGFSVVFDPKGMLRKQLKPTQELTVWKLRGDYAVQYQAQ